MKCFKCRSELHVIAKFHIIVHEIAKVNNTVAKFTYMKKEKSKQEKIYQRSLSKFE